MNPNPATVHEALLLLESGALSSEELVAGALERADALDAELGVFISRYSEQAIAAARDSDKARSQGNPIGPLEGIPIGVKDIITTEEGPTTAQSLVFDQSSFSGDATVVARLRAAGAVIVGKTSTMEFAIGTPDFEKPFPIPRNPWNTETWTGGSSSGTGGGVAAEMFLAGLGTDTGGSIRIPAATCGITGLKPTYGRVPKDGCAPLGFSLDHIGPMARTSYDCALMLNVMAGHSSADPTSADVPTQDYTAGLGRDLTGMRVGIARMAERDGEFSASSELDAGFAELAAALTSLGAVVIPVTLPHYEVVATAGLVLMIAEGYAYHRQDLQQRWNDYSQGLRECLGMGPFYTAADVVQAQRVRSVGRDAVGALLEDVDVIITPTVSAGGFDFETVDRYWDGPSTVNLTGYWNACGNPVLSVPFGFTAAGLPLGVQIAGRAFDESTVLRVGHAFQTVTDHHLQRPAILEDSVLSAG